MKQLIKRFFFKAAGPNRILFGIAKGMHVNYGIENRTLHLLGLYETEIYPFLRKGMDVSDTLIDIGANDGYYALAFCRHMNGNQKVILCEPGAVVSDLRKNLVLNNLKESATVVIETRLVTEKSNENEVSINELVSSSSAPLILMDVDGVEEVIIRGFDFELNTGKSITWVIETHSAELENNIRSILESHGFKVTIIRNAWWRRWIPEKRPLAHNRWLYAFK